MLYLESPDITRARRKPGQSLQRHDGAEEVGQVIAVGDIDAALDSFEPEPVQHLADVAIRLRYTLRMVQLGFVDAQIEGDREYLCFDRVLEGVR